MAITLICSGCKARLKVGEDRAGTTLGCPKCKTALDVPAVGTPPSKPVPMDLDPEPEPVPLEIDPEPDPDDAPDPDYLLRWRRKSRRARNRLLFLVSAVVLLGTACAIVVPMVIRKGVDAQTAKGEKGESNPRTNPLNDSPGTPPVSLEMSGDGPDWTYRELLDYLRSRGLVLTMAPNGASQLYTLTDASGREGWGAVCVKTGSAHAAKEMAGRHESEAFAWGRYCFTGDDEVLDLFRQALTSRAPVNDGFTDWSSEQLMAHLKRRGLSVKTRAFNNQTATFKNDPHTDQMLLVFTDRDSEADDIARLYDKATFLGGFSAWIGDKVPDPATAAKFHKAIVCVRTTLHVHARKVAWGVSWEGRTAFAWRRFAFATACTDQRFNDDARAVCTRVREVLGPP